MKPTNHLVVDEGGTSGEFAPSEVGLIPLGWKIVNLREISDKITDGEHLTPLREDSGYYLLSARNIQNGRLDISDVDYVGEDEFRRLQKRCDPREGDILISCSGTIGRVSLVPREFDCVLVRSAALIKTNKEQVDSRFIHYWLRGEAAQAQIRSSVNQGAQPNLFLNQIERILCALPLTKLEQSSIAEALSDIELLIEALQEKKAKKRAIKQGAMQALLSGSKRLPGFNGKWHNARFSQIFEFLPTATNARSDLGDSGDAYYIHYGDIHTRFHDHLDFRHSSPPRILRALCRNAALLKNGDWLMADASEDIDGVGKSVEVMGLADGDAAVSGLHTFLLRERRPTFFPGFKGHLGNLHALRSQYMRVMTGMKVFGVSKAALRDLVLPIPDWREQQAITETLDDLQAEISALDSGLSKARQLKQGMMQELLSGRVRLV